MRKSIDIDFSRPLSILSAFQRDSLPGMIYVEARSAKQVQEACAGLVGGVSKSWNSASTHWRNGQLVTTN